MRIQGPRTFLARPFYRDYVLGYVLIGLGGTLLSCTFPNPKDHVPFLIAALILLPAGILIFLTAITWSLLQLIPPMPRRSETPPPAPHPQVKTPNP